MNTSKLGTFMESMIESRKAAKENNEWLRPIRFGGMMDRLADVFLDALHSQHNGTKLMTYEVFTEKYDWGGTPMVKAYRIWYEEYNPVVGALSLFENIDHLLTKLEEALKEDPQVNLKKVRYLGGMGWQLVSAMNGALLRHRTAIHVQGDHPDKVLQIPNLGNIRDTKEYKEIYNAV